MIYPVATKLESRGFNRHSVFASALSALEFLLGLLWLRPSICASSPFAE